MESGVSKPFVWINRKINILLKIVERCAWKVCVSKTSLTWRILPNKFRFDWLVSMKERKGERCVVKIVRSCVWKVSLSRLKWGSFQWNRIGGGRTEPRNGKRSGRKMETICSTSVNPSGRLNMTSLNCFSYYVYISNILSLYYRKIISNDSQNFYRKLWPSTWESRDARIKNAFHCLHNRA